MTMEHHPFLIADTSSFMVVFPLSFFRFFRGLRFDPDEDRNPSVVDGLVHHLLGPVSSLVQPSIFLGRFASLTIFQGRVYHDPTGTTIL